MNEKNMHGRVFKKLREERGYKSKDVAGDIISTRTLTRFEADETSLPIATFEKLLENCGISYLDFLVYYYDYTEIETTNFANRMQSYLQTGSSSMIVNECKKELKKKDIAYSIRLNILTLINAIGWTDDKELFDENKRIIKEKIERTNKLGYDEIYGLLNLICFATKEDYSVKYIDRIIEECLQNIPVRNHLSKTLGLAYCDLLISALAFLSRNGYYDLAERRCKETIKLYNEQPMLLNKASNSKDVAGLLAKIYLRQNKKDGVELANKCLKYDHIITEITGDLLYKYIRDSTYKSFCEVNKTGIDIEF